MPVALDIAEVIYIDVPDMSEAEILQVMNWIKKKVTMQRNLFCWKTTYGRGAGTIPGRPTDCPHGYANTGATCTREHDAYTPGTAAESCPSGCYDSGLRCTKNLGHGGCSIITPWQCDCGDYHCPSGYRPDTGTCRENCADGYTMVLGDCHRSMDVKGPDDMTCKAGEEKKISPLFGFPRCYPVGRLCVEDEDAGLCYNNCRAGFVSVNVCHD